MIDPDADRPVHRQLADLLRTQIRSGVLRPGDQLPAENRLAQVHAVGRDTVRAAVAILRSEGLVTTRAPYGTVVRRQPSRRPVNVQRGSVVRVWMPDPDERRTHKVGEGIPLLEIRHPDGVVDVFPADEVELVYT